MSKKLRKRAFLSLCILFTLTFGLSSYLKVKSDTISKLNWVKYTSFVNTNGITIGFETFFRGQDQTMADQLFFEALNSKEATISKRYVGWSDLGFLFSFILFLVGFFLLTFNSIQKSLRWMFHSKQRSILSSAALFLLASLFFPPFIVHGQIYYSFLLLPFWNNSKIFWPLLLIEWTIILLPLGLIYKRLYHNYKHNSYPINLK